MHLHLFVRVNALFSLIGVLLTLQRTCNLTLVRLGLVEFENGAILRHWPAYLAPGLGLVEFENGAIFPALALCDRMSWGL